jgi:membrane-bound metal-dependent hydrolase YbcI (DUF457 family)
MLGRDHALSGAVAFTAAAPLLHATGIIPVAAGAVLTAGAALLPDLDHPRSSAARTLGPVTRALAWVIARLSGGHRHGTHSLAGIAAFTAVVAMTAGWSLRHSLSCPADPFTGPAQRWVLDRGAWCFPVHAWQQLPAALVTVLLLASALRALRIGGHHGDLLAIGGAAAITWLDPVTLLWALPVTVAIGCAVHIAGDALTDDGCPLLYPVSRREFHLLPKWLRFTTGRFAEHWAVSPLLLAGLAAAAARALGLT